MLQRNNNLNERAPEDYGGRSSDYDRGYNTRDRDDYHDDSYSNNRRDWDTDPNSRPTGKWTSSSTTTNFNDNRDDGTQREGLGAKMRGMLNRNKNNSRDHDSYDSRRSTGQYGARDDSSRGRRYDDDDDDEHNGTNWNVDFGGRGYNGRNDQGYQNFEGPLWDNRQTNDWYYNQNGGQDGLRDTNWQSNRDSTWINRPTNWDTKSFGRTGTFVGRNKSRQLGSGSSSSFQSMGNQPAVDIYELGNEFIIEMDLPGYTRECVEMKLYGSELVLTCTPVSTANRATSFLVNERTSSRQMKRTLHLPPSADSKRINAQLSNGVLKITIPKHAGTTIQPSLGSSNLSGSTLSGSGNNTTTGTTGTTSNITRVGSNTSTTNY